MEKYRQKFHGGDSQFSGLVHPNGLGFNTDDTPKLDVKENIEKDRLVAAPRMYSKPGDKTYDVAKINFDKTTLVHFKAMDGFAYRGGSIDRMSNGSRQ